LLADAIVRPSAVRDREQHLTQFLQSYLPCFYRKEQRDWATLVIHGRLSDLQRKASELIAHQAGRHCKPVHHLVGAGAWDDEAVIAELRQHVANELGDPNGVLVVDHSGFAKKGNNSCGVARQWCGRLTEEERQHLQALVNHGKRAWILLQPDQIRIGECSSPTAFLKSTATDWLAWARIDQRRWGLFFTSLGSVLPMPWR
jgi:SRSO17 transposase